jgi:protein-tyrosine phosphatase
MEYLKKRNNFGGSNSPLSNSTSSSSSDAIDFDEAGRQAMADLGIDGSTKDEQGNLTPIWRHPNGGSIYVGNIYVAESLATQKKFAITGVVNCTHGHGAISNFHENKKDGPQYYRFPISQWFNYINATNSSVYAFSDPMFNFIEEHISNGGNVLVHCLAGAHRAGTTGVACLMHFARLNQIQATITAKKLRPIIDPIGQLPHFLQRLEVAQIERRSKTSSA